MRSPVLLGVLAALLVVLIVLAGVITVVPDLAPGAPPYPDPSPARPAAASTPSATPPPAATPAGPGLPGTGGTTGTGSPGAPPASGPGSPPAVGLQVGDRAPSLVLPRLGGGTVDLAALRGRPVWVNFIASWCPDCQDELPLMEGYSYELGPRIAIVLVDVHESPAVVSEFATRMRLDLPVAIDQAGAAQRTWSAYALPVHYWLDAQGIVRAVGYGELGPPQFLESVRRVIPGASLSP
jgi:cytochrome c biogenesis protein CcmG/thiol:disulfide interchange protein DsbE